MKRNWLIFIAFVLAALCGPSAIPADGQTPINSYTAEVLQGVSMAYGINDAVQVVGQNPDGRACLWQNGAVTDLGTLGGAESIAVGINNSAQVAGYSTTSAGLTHA